MPHEPRAAPDARSTTMLGDWTANLVTYRRQPIVLGLSGASFLATAVPLAPAKTLVPRFVESIFRTMMMIGVEGADIERELTAMHPCEVAPTNDRRALGVLNDFAFAFGRILDDGYTLRAATMRLADWVVMPLKHERPREAARRLLALTDKH